MNYAKFVCLVLVWCEIIIQNKIGGFIRIESGELRGDEFQRICISLGDNHYEGIWDIHRGWIVHPSTEYWVIESIDSLDEEGNIVKQYYGGKDTGVYWIESWDGNVAFLDIPSGYYSGLLYSNSTNMIFWNNGTKYLRVGNINERYAYVNRNDGALLTDYVFADFNFAGFVGSIAVERIYESEQYVVLTDSGVMLPLPERIEFDVNSLTLDHESSQGMWYSINSMDGDCYTIMFEPYSMDIMCQKKTSSLRNQFFVKSS